MIDEPSSFLVVKQRVKAVRVVRSSLMMKCLLMFLFNVVIYIHILFYFISYVLQLSILDYLSDFICVLYGQHKCFHSLF
jgi:translation initiation factor RLI1